MYNTHIPLYKMTARLFFHGLYQQKFTNQLRFFNFIQVIIECFTEIEWFLVYSSIGTSKL